MISRREVERPLEQRIAEVPALEIDPDLHPGGADTVVVGIVHVERKIQGPAREPDADDLDLPELDLGILERQPSQRGAGGGNDCYGDGQGPLAHVPAFPSVAVSPVAVASVALFFIPAHHSIRFLMSFS